MPWGNPPRRHSVITSYSIHYTKLYDTLYDALRAVAVLSAPVTPFVSDWLHTALTGGSVHLERFPRVDTLERDGALEEEMDAARRLVSLGRAAREEVGIRVRQPLRTLHAVVPGGGLRVV